MYFVQAWLDPVNLPTGNSSCCGFCGEPLHFVLQVIALCLEAIVPVIFFPELVLVKSMKTSSQIVFGSL